MSSPPMPPNNPPPETCPKCEAPQNKDGHWGRHNGLWWGFCCHSYQRDDGYFSEAIACKDRQIAALTKELAALKAAARWIPVGERLPKKGPDHAVLIYSRAGAIWIAWLATMDDGFLYTGGFLPMSNVTAWRPLPEGPKEEK